MLGIFKTAAPKIIKILLFIWQYNIVHIHIQSICKSKLSVKSNQKLVKCDRLDRIQSSARHWALHIDALLAQ